DDLVAVAPSIGSQPRLRIRSHAEIVAPQRTWTKTFRIGTVKLSGRHSSAYHSSGLGGHRDRTDHLFHSRDQSLPVCPSGGASPASGGGARLPRHTAQRQDGVGADQARRHPRDALGPEIQLRPPQPELPLVTARSGTFRNGV